MSDWIDLLRTGLDACFKQTARRPDEIRTSKTTLKKMDDAIMAIMGTPPQVAEPDPDKPPNCSRFQDLPVIVDETVGSDAAELWQNGKMIFRIFNLFEEAPPC